MKKNTSLAATYVIIFLALFCVGCKKDWLEEKSDISYATPGTLDDFQKLLDNSTVFNTIHTYLGELSSGDFYILPATFTSQSVIRQNCYIWATSLYPGQTEAISINDWFYPWQRIFYANNVLDGLAKMMATGERYNSIKGAALFYRGFNYYTLLQEFAPPFKPTSATTDLGMPLRLTSNIEASYSRSSVQATYDQIIADLKAAIPLLPITPAYKTRPSKPAVYALLSRVYLNMFQYENAGKYADSCLQLYKTLIDYKTLSSTATFPIAVMNAEVIYHMAFSNVTMFSSANMIVDSNLYASYTNDDFRKTIFYATSGTKASYKGSYSGNVLLFGGIATDEVLLTRAECYARQGNVQNSMRDLDSLTIKRYKTFTQNTATSAAEALNKVLAERRKELVFRGLRWTDLRRLNLEGANIQLTRVLNGTTYTLPPNSKRYVLAIPDDEIATSGIQQNDRND
jgi:tetratricopeptide (TPR) repeat protein